MSGNTVVMKGEILRRADLNLNAPSTGQSDNLKHNSLWQAGVNEVILQPGDEPHVKGDWFGANWWPHIDGKEQILSSAYVKAIDLANTPPEEIEPEVALPLPIRSLWISGVRRETDPGVWVDVFEVAVMPSSTQVTVVLVTPPHPKTAFPQEADTFPDLVWLAASAARIKDVRDSYPAEYSLEPDEEPIPGNGARTQRLIGY